MLALDVTEVLCVYGGQPFPDIVEFQLGFPLGLVKSFGDCFDLSLQLVLFGIVGSMIGFQSSHQRINFIVFDFQHSSKPLQFDIEEFFLVFEVMVDTLELQINNLFVSRL